ncbi:hypothetical protein [Nocardia xishanensis]
MAGEFRRAAVTALALITMVTVAGCGETDAAQPQNNYGGATAATSGSASQQPAPVPSTIDQAALAPGTRELMAKVRATDACAMHDPALAARLGAFQRFDRDGSWTRCRMFVADAGDPAGFFRFDLDLVDDFLAADRGSLYKPDQLAGRTVFMRFDNDHPGAWSCSMRIAHGDTGFAATLKVSRLAPPKNSPIPWDQACAFTREYLTAILGNLVTLPPRPIGIEDGRSLIQKDPCPAEGPLTAAFPEWKVKSTGLVNAYECKLTLRRDDAYGKVEVSVRLQANAEQVPSEGETRLPAGLDGGQLVVTGRYQARAGLTGTETRTVHSADPGVTVGCSAALVYRPSNPSIPNSAQLITIGVDIDRTGAAPRPDACQALDRLAGDIVTALG